MYLIPKNIKTKKEIFKGFGIIEILVMGVSFCIGFLFQSFVIKYKLKIFLSFLKSFYYIKKSKKYINYKKVMV